MNLLRRILVATDFGAAADEAVSMAGFVARQFRSQVDVLHVKSGKSPAAGSAESIAEGVAKAEARLREAGAAAVKTHVVDGNALEQIERVAQQEDVNVIMAGVGDIFPSGQVCLGPLASRLRQKSSKPVWIVKPETGPPIHRILCPVDFSPSSAKALRNAIHLARGLRAVLSVLTVKSSLTEEFEETLDFAEDGEHSLRSHLPEYEEFLRGFDFHNVHWRCVARRGKAQSVIPEFAKEIRAHLLVMGSVGRSGVSRMLVGGVARRVAQEMPCSIITVRQEDLIRCDMEEQPAEPSRSQCEAQPTYADCPRHSHGEELLEQGFAEEAITYFEDCIAAYSECPKAWESMAIAHERLSHERDARQCKERADQIRQRQLNQQIQDELRGKYATYRELFGIEYE